MKKILVVLLTLSFALPSFAEDEIQNKAVEEDVEIMLATFDENGKLVPVTEPVTVEGEEAGEFEVEIPEDFPEHKPLFIVVNDSAGEGTQQIAYVNPEGEENAEVDPAATTAFNSFASMAKNTGFDPKDADPQQLEEFFDDVKDAIKDVPPDENPAKTMERMAQALSFNPEALLNAGGHFNVPKDKLVQVAVNIDKAAAPSGFDPFEGLPSGDFSAIPPGLVTAGLLPPAFFEKNMPPEFKDFNKAFCETCPPPGGFEFVGEDGKKAEIPKGTFMMPPGVKANPQAKFPESPVFPPGVSIPKDFKMPAKAILPPGAILEDGFVPPAGLAMPPGVLKPEGFDEKFAGTFVPQDEFIAPEGFTPPPGFAIADPKTGSFMMPPDFPLPKGTKIADGLAMEFPAPKGFKAPPLPPGTEATNFEPPAAGFAFPDGFKAPKGFDPQAMGFVPPAGFVPSTFQPPKGDFSEFKGDNFAGFDPFGGKFVPGTAPFVPPAAQQGIIDGLIASGLSPEEAKAKFDADQTSGGFFAPAPPIGPANPPQDDGFDGKGDDGPIFNDGGTNLPPPDGSTNPPPPDGSTNPLPDGGTNPPPPDGSTNPPPPDGSTNPPPATLVKRSRYAVSSLTENNTRPVAVKSATTVKAGAKLAVTISTGTKAKKVTASEGVYLVGKARAGATAAQLPLLVDPSISSSTVKVTVAEADNSVDVESYTVDADSATQLITSLDGKTIEMSTSGISDDLGISKVTGYLLAPGTSSLKMQKAIPVKGTVEEGTSGQIVSFAIPAAKFKKLDDGVYTVVFQDGDKSYYGKLTIGTLRSRTIKGVVKAPNGQL